MSSPHEVGVICISYSLRNRLGLKYRFGKTSSPCNYYYPYTDIEIEFENKIMGLLDLSSQAPDRSSKGI